MVIVHAITTVLVTVVVIVAVVVVGSVYKDEQRLTQGASRGSSSETELRQVKKEKQLQAIV
jgi:hypothetical protein